MTAEGSSNDDSDATEPAQTSTQNPLDDKGTQVCQERRYNRDDANPI